MARRTSQTRYLLANQILGIVRDGRFEVGHHLREQQLGSLLQVSRTPVRSALALLAEMGVLETRRNHGFFLKAGVEELRHAAVAIPAAAYEDLYAALMQDRLAGRLPASFTQAEIARRYDVDRPLLLRTLSLLVDDGLLDRNSGRGWSFLPTLDSGSALRSSYDFRQTIEPAGLLLDTFKVDTGALERSRLHHLYLEAHPRIDTVDRRQLFDTDAQFHEMVAGFSGNAFFLQAVQQQNRLRRLLEFAGYGNRRRVRDWCREHLAIIEAVAAGETVRAGGIMRRHLENAFAAVPDPASRRARDGERPGRLRG